LWAKTERTLAGVRHEAAYPRISRSGLYPRSCKVDTEQRLEPVGLICDECGVLTIEDGRGWQAYLTDDEPAEVATFCPACAARESGDP
jgi:hypothetical protein